MRDDREFIVQTKNRISNGGSHSEILNNLRNQGVGSERGVEIYKNAKRELNEPKLDQANKDMLFGFGLLALGALITGYTWLSASAGGTYFVMWGPILFGGYRAMKGVIGRSWFSTSSSGTVAWIGVGAVSVVVVGGAGLAVYDAGSLPDPPPDDAIRVESEAEQSNSVSAIKFTGTVFNDDSEWTATEVVVLIDINNAAGWRISHHEVDIDDIPPNGQVRYSTTVSDLPENADNYDEFYEWVWELR